MEKTCDDALIGRLERLERENLRLKQLGIWALLATAAMVVMGTDLVRSPKRVVAEQFLVRDRDGQVRAKLSLEDDGSTSLAMLDKKGQNQVLLHALDNSTTSLSLFDKGQVRMAMSSSPTGSAVLNLFSRHQGAASGLYVWPDGSTGLGFRDGRRGLDISVSPDGTSELKFTDAHGKTIGGMAVDAEGLPHSLVREKDAEVSPGYGPPPLAVPIPTFGPDSGGGPRPVLDTTRTTLGRDGSAPHPAALPLREACSLY